MKLPWPKERPIEFQHTSLARFCAAQGILHVVHSTAPSHCSLCCSMYYFLAAQAFFAICFTIVSPFIPSQSLPSPPLQPMLIIAMQSAKLWREDSVDSSGSKTPTKHVKLPSAYLLTVTPFVWALPMIFLAIPVIMSLEAKGYPAIYYAPVRARHREPPHAYTFTERLLYDRLLCLSASQRHIRGSATHRRVHFCRLGRGLHCEVLLCPQGCPPARAKVRICTLSHIFTDITSR